MTTPSLRGAKRRSNPVGRRSHPKPLWIASLALAMTSSFVLALRFLFAPRGLPKLCTNGPPQREAERRKARIERPLRAIRALPLGGVAARAPLGRRARLPALYRGSRQRPFGLRLSPVPRFMVADNRSAPRAASSWQTGDGAGRASFRTARTQFAKPRPGTALAPPFGSHPECALG
jgi:hypothetical protein